MSKWRSIDTAPKDGSYILLANEHGSWVGTWKPVFVSGFRPDNPWSSMMLNHRHMKRFASIVPTHWQPMPPAPSTPRFVIGPRLSGDER